MSALALEAVLEAVERGESVLAVNGQKKPWYAWKRYQEIPADRDQIEAWAMSRDCAGFAVVTGAVSGLVVLDFDDADGIALCERLGLEPHVQTPSGGFHVRFAHPGFRVKTLNSETGKALQSRWHGLDIRADGGYAVEWGRNNGGEYRVLRDLAELERLDGLPDELLADLGIVQNGSTAPATATEPDPQRKVRHPGRHAHLLGVGGAMRGRGEGKAAILAELRKVNRSDCDPPKSDEEIVALAEDLAARYEPEKLAQYKVTIDDKGKLKLPPKPKPDDVTGLCLWPSGVFNLDPAHPITGGERQGLHGPEGHVELQRAGAPPFRFEPASRLVNPTRLREVLETSALPSDGEIPGFKAEHTYAIAHVLRMLCAHTEGLSAEAETFGIVDAFLADATPVEGQTTYGTAGQRYEAAAALQHPPGAYGEPARYLLDSDTGEFVVRVRDLAASARRQFGSLPRGWLDARMRDIGWRRVVLDGHALPGRAGNASHHARANVYRGFLATGSDDSVST